MRIRIVIALVVVLLAGCEEKPGYHDYADLKKYWLTTDTIRFRVPVKDSVAVYSVSMEVRCSVDYQWSRFFSGYEIQDSTGRQLDSGLVNVLLFDPVTGAPKGKGGIGDLYETSVTIRDKFQFPYKGQFRILFWQMMRRDSLEGISNIGLRIEPKSTVAQ